MMKRVSDKTNESKMIDVMIEMNELVSDSIGGCVCFFGFQKHTQTCDLMRVKTRKWVGWSWIRVDRRSEERQNFKRDLIGSDNFKSIDWDEGKLGGQVWYLCGYRGFEEEDQWYKLWSAVKVTGTELRTSLRNGTVYDRWPTYCHDGQEDNGFGFRFGFG